MFLYKQKSSEKGGKYMKMMKEMGLLLAAAVFVLGTVVCKTETGGNSDATEAAVIGQQRTN